MSTHVLVMFISFARRHSVSILAEIYGNGFITYYLWHISFEDNKTTYDEIVAWRDVDMCIGFSEESVVCSY